MTRQNFDKLTRQQKRITLLRYGTYISERSFGPLRIMLYQLEGFYVEVFFLKWNKSVLWYRSFNTTNLLDPYLHKIDLSSLMQEFQYKNH